MSVGVRTRGAKFRSSTSGLRAAPGGGGVRAVAAVEEHEARGEVLVAQVGVEPPDLRQLGEPLVDDGAVREARDREVDADLLAQHLVEGEAEEVAAGQPSVLAQPLRAAEEGLAHHRRRPARGGARRGEKAHPARVGCVVGSAANTLVGAHFPMNPRR